MQSLPLRSVNEEIMSTQHDASLILSPALNLLPCQVDYDEPFLDSRVKRLPVSNLLLGPVSEDLAEDLARLFWMCGSAFGDWGERSMM